MRPARFLFLATFVIAACGGAIKASDDTCGADAPGVTAVSVSDASVPSTAPAPVAPNADGAAPCAALPAMAMPIDFLRGRSDVLLVFDGDSIAYSQSQIVPWAVGAPPGAFVNVAVTGKTMATMDQEFAGAVRPAIVASGATIKLVSTNGGINDMRNGGPSAAATCAHLASWCGQVHDAGAKAIVFELSPVWQTILSVTEQSDYVACENALVAEGTCDYLIARDLAFVEPDGDGGYVESVDAGMLSDGLHPTPEGAYRAALRYARLVYSLTNPGAGICP